MRTKPRLEPNHRDEPQHIYLSDNARLPGKYLSDGVNAYEAPLENLIIGMSHNIPIHRIAPLAGQSSPVEQIRTKPLFGI